MSAAVHFKLTTTHRELTLDSLQGLTTSAAHPRIQEDDAS